MLDPSLGGGAILDLYVLPQMFVFYTNMYISNSAAHIPWFGYV